MEQPAVSGRKRLLIVVVTMVIGVLLCAGVITLLIDRACSQHFQQVLPLYPDAEIVSEEHNSLRTFGMGSTLMTLHTPDTPEVVRDWYANTIRQNTLNYAGPSLVDSAEWDVEETEGGSRITLYGSCGV